ncbi:MAG TPA: TlpA disulfide reductase family protein [Planctomycetaceae bacterium]|nr:TlpA disulfide reductase family protein [Planctomycetaceae bacterium]
MAENRSIRGFTILLFGVLLGSLLMVALIRNSIGKRGGRTEGRAPAIDVAGWVNGELPQDLGGKVVVIDAFASWCGPCREALPELIQTYEHFEDRGVLFVGLTSETPEDLEYVQKFVKLTGIPWPVGYGALPTLRALQVRMIPQVFVIGGNGQILWNLDSARTKGPATLDEAIEQALAANREKSAAAPASN